MNPRRSNNSPVYVYSNKLLLTYMYMKLRSLKNAITVKEFRAIMVTDSVRPTTIQVIHSGEEAIREVFSCFK